VTAGKLTTDSAASFPQPNVGASALAWARAVMQRVAQLEDDQAQAGTKALEANKTLIQTLRRTAVTGADPTIYTHDGIVTPEYGWQISATNPVDNELITRMVFDFGGLEVLANSDTLQSYLEIAANQQWMALGQLNNIFSSAVFSTLDDNFRPRVYIASSGPDALDQNYVQNQSLIAAGYSDDGTPWVRILGRYFSGALGGSSTEPTGGAASSGSGTIGGTTPAGGNGSVTWLGKYSDLPGETKTETYLEFFTVADMQTGYGQGGPNFSGSEVAAGGSGPLGTATQFAPPSATNDAGNVATDYKYSYGDPRQSTPFNPAVTASDPFPDHQVRGYWKAGGSGNNIKLTTQVNGQTPQNASSGGGWNEISAAYSDTLGVASYTVAWVPADPDNPWSYGNAWVAHTAGKFTAISNETSVGAGSLVTDGIYTWLSLRDTTNAPGNGSDWAEIGIVDPSARETLVQWFRGDWTNTHNYLPGEVVAHNGFIWIALLPGGEQYEPGTNAAFWEQFAATTGGGGSASVSAADESTAGIIRIATTDEATAGTDDSTAISPQHLHEQLVIAAPPPADDTTAGIIRIATSDEATAGTDTTTAMTPAEVKAAMSAGAYTLLQGWKGTYDQAVTYGPGDLVRFNGALVLALDASTGSLPPTALPDTSDWAVVVAKVVASTGGTGGGNGPLVVGPTNSLTMPGLWLQTDNDGNFIEWWYDDHSGIGGSNTNGDVSFGPTNGLQVAGLWIQTDENLVPQALIYDDGNH
jgi:hypothetical protein